MIIANITDFREAARRRRPRFLFEYIDGGSYDEGTLSRNISDLAEIALRQRMLRDVSQIDVAIEVFGHPWALPVALAPIGLAGCTRIADIERSCLTELHTIRGEHQ